MALIVPASAQDISVLNGTGSRGAARVETTYAYRAMVNGDTGEKETTPGESTEPTESTDAPDQSSTAPQQSESEQGCTAAAGASMLIMLITAAAAVTITKKKD